MVGCGTMDWRDRPDQSRGRRDVAHPGNRRPVSAGVAAV